MGNISKYGWACALNLLAAAGCSGVRSAEELNDDGLPPATGGSSGAAAGGGGSGATGGATAGTAGSAGATGGTGGASGAGASGGSAAATAGGTSGLGGVSGAGAGGGAGTGGDTTSGGAGGGVSTGGTAGDTATGGMAGTAGDTGSGGTAGAGGTAGTSGRSGPFKMLVYSRTEGHPHDSIPAGQQMLRSIADDYGFEVTETTENNEITLEGLSQYEIVFFMNTSGDVFDPQHEAAFEEWMTTRDGAFAGSHSATDTERDWAFYKELTGQYYDSHESPGPGTIQWEADAVNFVAVSGLPTPWQRNEEWYFFRSWEQWSTKGGFRILSKVTTNAGGTRPVSFIREYNRFRSFYSSLGHFGPTFEDPDVERHFAAGIMWAVRREAMVQ